MQHQASVFAGTQPSRSSRAAGTARLDATARQLRMALRFLSLPLATAAQAFHRAQGWKEFGYARLSDYARERLDRSARWVRDLADFDEAVQRLPGLAAALTGEDGGRPIGLVAARHIGKVATPESLGVWLSMARTHSLGAFKTWVRRAAAAGSPWPVAATDSSAQDLPAEGDASQSVCLFVPAAVGEAFAETLDLYRAVEGHTAPVGEFVDSLIAEASSGALAGKIDFEGPGDVPRGALPQATVLGEARRHGKANLQPGNDEASALPKGGGIPNGRATACSDKTFHGGNRQLTPVDRRRFATQLPTGSPQEDAALRARVCRWLRQVVGDALGKPGHTVSRPALVAGSPRTAQPSSASASASAVDADARMRRLLSLHDEIERQLAEVVTEMADTTAWVGLGYHGLDDYARRGLGWSRSTLYSRVQRVQALTRMALAAPGPLLPLRLYLTRETAADLSRVLAVACRDPSLIKTFSSLQSTCMEARSVKGAECPAFQTVSVHRAAVPVWVALLALMQEFIETWDVDVGGRRPSTQRIYNRDGWRCMAPSCTSRRNLEVHHVVYRSHTGSSRPENLVCLCRFHHQMGEHGLLARVRGEAPLGLTWRLGRDGRGGQFRNELRIR